MVAIMVLQYYSLTTVLFPAVAGTVCELFILVVIYRRRLLASQTPE